MNIRDEVKSYIEHTNLTVEQVQLLMDFADFCAAGTPGARKGLEMVIAMIADADGVPEIKVDSRGSGLIGWHLVLFVGFMQGLGERLDRDLVSQISGLNERTLTAGRKLAEECDGVSRMFQETK